MRRRIGNDMEIAENNQKTNQELLNRNLEQLCKAIELCIKEKLISPSLILLYSAIDITAWIAMDEPSTKERFIGWVETYLLPMKKIRCTAMELYAARCGLVHRFSADANLIERGEGNIRRIMYAWGNSNVSSLQEMIELGKLLEYVPVKVEELFEAYCLGLRALQEDLSKDPIKASKVYDKAGRFFVTMSEAESRELINLAKNLLSSV